MAAETVIESFCERCGTRYTFEPVRKRESKLVGLGKQLGILLEDHAAGLAQRDPFHGTFHFCLECRQYTCPRCWNEAAGFCLGCVPLPGAPDTAALDAAEAEADLEVAVLREQAAAEHDLLDDPGAWPDADLLRRRGAADAWPEAALAAERSATPGTEETPAAEPEPGAEAEADAWSLTFEPEPVVEAVPSAEGAEWDDLESDAGLDIAALAAAAEMAEARDEADPMVDAGAATDVALPDEPATALEEPEQGETGPVWFDEAAGTAAGLAVIALDAPEASDAERGDDGEARPDQDDDDRLGLIGLAAITGAVLVEEALDADDDSDATVLAVEDVADEGAAEATPETVDADAIAATADPAIEADGAGAEWDLAAAEEATATSAEPEGAIEAEADPDAEMAAGSVDADMAETADLEATADAELDSDIVAEPVEDLALATADVDVEPVDVESVDDVAVAVEAEPVEAELDAVDLEPVAALAAEAADDVAIETPAIDPAPVAAALDADIVGAAAQPEPVAELAMAADADDEADWADLIRHLPPSLDDEPSADEWAAMAPALGPDIAPSPDPVAPASPAVPAAPAPAPAPAPSIAWQLSPPVADAESRPTAWPPLGPVFRPAPTPPPAAPHPSVLAPRPGSGGLLARSQATSATPSALPNGVRPCRNCELPLSASARFCRRCGRPQG